MHLSTRLIPLALLLSAPLSMSACGDTADSEWSDDPIDIPDTTFRCLGIGCDGGNYNTNFIGDKPEFMFWDMPTSPGGDPLVDLDEIHFNKCYDITGATLHGHYVVQTPTLSIDSLGDFAPIPITNAVGATICEAYGDALLNSDWFLSGDIEKVPGTIETVDVRLTITAINHDPFGRTFFQWESEHDLLYGVPGTGATFPTCDEADDDIPANLRFSAMMYPELRIDEATGNFSEVPGTAHISCLSGAQGKADAKWGYDQTPLATRQVATNATMATYCGGGHSFTEPGTPLYLWQVDGGTGPHMSPPVAGTDWEIEAVWKADNTAMCIGTTRLPKHQPPAGSLFDCDPLQAGGELPLCTQNHIDDNDAVLVSYAYVGGLQL